MPVLQGNHAPDVKARGRGLVIRNWTAPPHRAEATPATLGWTIRTRTREAAEVRTLSGLALQGRAKDVQRIWTRKGGHKWKLGQCSYNGCLAFGPLTPHKVSECLWSFSVYTASVSLTREIVYSLGRLRAGVTEKRPKKAALSAPQLWLKAVLGLKPGAETPGDTVSKEHSCLVPSAPLTGAHCHAWFIQTQGLLHTRQVHYSLSCSLVFCVFKNTRQSYQPVSLQAAPASL